MKIIKNRRKNWCKNNCRRKTGMKKQNFWCTKNKMFGVQKSNIFGVPKSKIFGVQK